ncbi:hypothetical protein [Cupriavidus basilensis]|uniref:hypothetical protein n=1 Tax=Cupriavidus basilensis TaxID=68895 RepID=UPI0012E0AA74|nr:hypothetical protein [Cupriavidus basilensis]
MAIYRNEDEKPNCQRQQDGCHFVELCMGLGQDLAPPSHHGAKSEGPALNIDNQRKWQQDGKLPEQRALS